MSKDKTGHWKGKETFEDYVTNRLLAIENLLTETNELLLKIAGEDETRVNDVIAEDVSDSQDSFLQSLKDKAEDVIKDFSDDLTLNNSVPKKSRSTKKKD